MENEPVDTPTKEPVLREKLTVRFENLSIDNDTDLTETDEIEDSSNRVKFSSDYFSNESFFPKDDFIKLAEEIIGEKQTWRNQDISTLKEMLRNCEFFRSQDDVQKSSGI